MSGDPEIAARAASVRARCASIRAKVLGTLAAHEETSARLANLSALLTENALAILAGVKRIEQDLLAADVDTLLDSLEGPDWRPEEGD